MPNEYNNCLDVRCVREEIERVEAVLHVCCRDRNLLGLQAELLAASALGVRDLILITGDPPILGDWLHYPVDFIGRGDMSRGGLLLRRSRAREDPS